jgi:TolA-binding protein
MNEEPTRNEQPTREHPVLGQQRPVAKQSRFGAIRKSTVAVGLAAVFVVAAGAVAMSQTGNSTPSGQPVVLAGQEVPTTIETEVPATTKPATKAAGNSAAVTNSTNRPARCAARDARERAEDLREAQEELREAQETPTQKLARKRAEDLREAQEELREARETPAQRAARKRAEDLREAQEDIREAQEDILCGEYRG